MARALSEFLEKNEEAQILALDEEQIRDLTALFLAHEACSRLANDIGQIFESERISLKESLALLNEMRAYLRADLSTQIDQLWDTSANPSQSELDHILRSSLQRTFEIYEGEI